MREPIPSPSSRAGGNRHSRECGNPSRPRHPRTGGNRHSREEPSPYSIRARVTPLCNPTDTLQAGTREGKKTAARQGPTSRAQRHRVQSSYTRKNQNPGQPSVCLYPYARNPQSAPAIRHPKVYHTHNRPSRPPNAFPRPHYRHPHPPHSSLPHYYRHSREDGNPSHPRPVI